ncbi:hypothetical protein ACFZC6_12790 [Streptomyces ossamyceticus]|uniref:Uncharacterized protein n=1 Tax=Streptomyces ossamyceticus TaxID=249581 RepID=A0ABV2V2Z2_9ACTN
MNATVPARNSPSTWASRRTLRRYIEPKPAAATAPQHGKAAQ